MTHLIFDVLFIIIAIIMIALGIKRGFIKSLIRSAKLILSVVLAYLLGSHLGLILKDSFIGAPVYNFVYEKVNALYLDASSAINVEEITAAFPQFIMTEDVKQQIADATSAESGEALVESVTLGIADPISTLISNILGYILVFVLAFIGLSVVAWLLTALTDKIKLLGAANRVLGAVWGALMAAIILLMVASVIKLFFGETDFYQQTVVVKFFGDSALLEAIKIFNIGSAWFSQAPQA